MSQSIDLLSGNELEAFIKNNTVNGRCLAIIPTLGGKAFVVDLLNHGGQSFVNGIPCIVLGTFNDQDSAARAIKLVRAAEETPMSLLREIIEMLAEADFNPGTDTNPYYQAVRFLKINS